MHRSSGLYYYFHMKLFYRAPSACPRGLGMVLGYVLDHNHFVTKDGNGTVSLLSATCGNGWSIWHQIHGGPI